MTRISSDRLGLDGIYVPKNAANGIYACRINGRTFEVAIYD